MKIGGYSIKKIKIKQKQEKQLKNTCHTAASLTDISIHPKKSK